MHACQKEQVVTQEEVKVTRLNNMLFVQNISPLKGVLEAVNEATKQGKAFLSLFGTHSYSVTLHCVRD